VIAKVFVTLRRDVLDPQGEAVRRGLVALGYSDVTDVRVGKYMEIEIAGDRAQAEGKLREMCEKLLANTVIEDFRFEIDG
jgi:phosphoribosylformylglycinamidine synthase